MARIIDITNIPSRIVNLMRPSTEYHNSASCRPNNRIVHHLNTVFLSRHIVTRQSDILIIGKSDLRFLV